jgi:hypothetical protein
MFLSRVQKQIRDPENGNGLAFNVGIYKQENRPSNHHLSHTNIGDRCIREIIKFYWRCIRETITIRTRPSGSLLSYAINHPFFSCMGKREGNNNRIFRKVAFRLG